MDSEPHHLPAAAAVLGSVNDTILDDVHQRSIAERGLSSFGGYGLIAKTCPSGTDTCGSGCCPSGYNCQLPTAGSMPVICCPTTDSCQATVAALKACADNSWAMYQFADYFCCASGTTGTWSSGGGYLCLDSSLPIPSSISLTQLSQAVGTKTAVATGSPSKAASTTGSDPNATSPAGTGLVPSSSPTLSGAAATTRPADEAVTSTASQGLPQAAMIAIAVLATALGMLLLFVGWYCVRRRKRANLAQSRHRSERPDVPAAVNLLQMHPGTVQYSDAMSPDTPLRYKPQTPTPRTTELPGYMHHPPTGPVYETSGAHQAELESPANGR